jgi:glucose/arabinose dehydrogenase
MTPRTLTILYPLLSILFLSLPAPAPAQLPATLPSDLGPAVPAFKVRPGYRVTRALPEKHPLLRDARFIEFSADGKTLFLSQRREGNILALRDPDSDGMYKTITLFVKNQSSAQGMCFHDGWLYFGRSSEGSVTRARDTNNDGVADDVQVVLPKGSTPAGGGHPFEAVFVTDTAIYISSSDPTNMTEELNSDRKTIYVFDVDLKNSSGDFYNKPKRKVFCTGIRNTEKLRYRPGTTDIWGFDHGSDNFGKPYGEKTAKDQPITDLLPPEELNHYVQDGFYGHPYLSGNKIPRPEFAKRDDIIELADKTTSPEWNLHAHWAVNGFTFLSSDYFPNHKGDIFFAAHGSWNSITPVGALVGRVLFDQVTGHPYGSMTIVDCAGPDRRYARPCDCAEAPDGTILFTSDEPSALYRISKSGGR